MSTRFAGRPAPPYWAVIFTSQRTSEGDGYADAAVRMVELASARPGFLGVESARDASGLGITVSYWASPEAIAGWRADVEHALVRAEGRARWYEHYELRVAKVEPAYGWDRAEGPDPGDGRP